MHSSLIEEIAREIERLRRHYAAIMREAPGEREVMAAWTAEERDLRWFVPLEDVVESDIDVEILGEVVIVRANRTWPDPVILVGILPVPRGFDPQHPVIRFTEETLEVRIRRVRREVES